MISLQFGDGIRQRHEYSREVSCYSMYPKKVSEYIAAVQSIAGAGLVCPMVFPAQCEWVRGTPRKRRPLEAT